MINASPKPQSLRWSPRGQFWPDAVTALRNSSAQHVTPHRKSGVRLRTIMSTCPTYFSQIASSPPSANGGKCFSHHTSHSSSRRLLKMAPLHTLHLVCLFRSGVFQFFVLCLNAIKQRLHLFGCLWLRLHLWGKFMSAMDCVDLHLWVPCAQQVCLLPAMHPVPSLSLLK